MARYKETNKRQGQFIPVIFDDQILPGTIEHAICEIIDNHVDLSGFDLNYKNDKTGRPAIPPGILLKIILVSYSKGIFKSRRMEDAVKTNIQMMAVAEGLTPDHSTIATFISSMKNVIDNIFVDVLIRCGQLDLVGGDVFALDGCKLSSNAAKDKSGTFKELEKKKEKLKKILGHLIEQHCAGDTEPAELEKHKKKYQDEIKRIDDFLKTHEPKKGSRGKEIKSNMTDNESGKMISSHGMIQGYNGLACVDDKNQVIVSAEAFGQGNEGNLLPGMVEKAEENLGKAIEGQTLKNKTVIADTNYFSEDNCKYLADKEIDGYIPDQFFRNRDPRYPDNYPRRKGKKNLYSADDFTYDRENNCYICPAGKVLHYSYDVTIKGYKYRKYIIQKGVCSFCYLKTECLKKNSERRTLHIIISAKSKTYSEKMMDKIDTPPGRKIYSRRMGIVEPVFANIRCHKGLNEFTLRGKEKVNIQWMLYCIVHNIGKIARYYFIKILFTIFAENYDRKYSSEYFCTI